MTVATTMRCTVELTYLLCGWLQQLYQTFIDYDIRFYIYEVLKVRHSLHMQYHQFKFKLFVMFLFLFHWI